MKSKPTIGLALGSGASRGLAHIGVLQVLEEHDIIPDYISGSSIGSLIGALYAAGVNPRMMEGIAKNLDTKMYYDVTVPRYGFIRGNRIQELVRLLTGDRSFEELKIPLAVTAVDLIKCRGVILNKGKVHKAVRASISIPGIFMPVEDGDRVLVDGGVLERVPVKAVKEMGADITIGVDVGFRGEHRKAVNIFEVFLQSMEIMEMEILKNKMPDEGIMIYPSLNKINPLVFDQVDECIVEGRRATLEVVDDIKEKIRSKQ